MGAVCANFSKILSFLFSYFSSLVKKINRLMKDIWNWCFSGHSLEVLSISEINRSSEVDTPNSNDVLQSEAVNSSENPEHSGLSASGRACLSSSSDGNRVAGDGTGRENVAIDQDADQGLASANVVQETPPEEYNAPVV